MKWQIHLAVAIVVAAVVVSLAATTVFAHSGYESSIPASDEVLPEAPERVDVWFTQDIVKRAGLYFVRVFDEAEAQVSDGDGVVGDDDRSHVFAELPPGLGPGRYIVRWMITSDIDGDADEGAFCFYVAVEPTAEQEVVCPEFEEGSVTDSDDGDSNTNLIVGVIVAIVAVVVTVGGGVVWLGRRE